MAFQYIVDDMTCDMIRLRHSMGVSLELNIHFWWILGFLMRTTHTHNQWNVDQQTNKQTTTKTITTTNMLPIDTFNNVILTSIDRQLATKVNNLAPFSAN